LYFSSVSFDNVLKTVGLALGTITKREAITVGFPSSRNFHKSKLFSMSASEFVIMLFSTFSKSTFRAAITAASVPSAPLGGIGGSCTAGHSIISALCSVSKSL